jgi:voltage-gated potassium channel
LARLVIVELAWGTSRALETFGTAIWIIFIVEYAVRLTLAPGKGAFLKRNWLTVIALVVRPSASFAGSESCGLREQRAASGWSGS